MNNVIDHAILIPTHPTAVWDYLRQIDTSPQWREDCERITFLNSIRDAPGMRWRSTEVNGNETVYEINAWYDRLGYEYTLVDGFPYPNRGRLRLQEVAEGTIVQWTFSYQTSGIGGSLRNTLGLKRRLDRNIVANLRGLYSYISSAASREANQPIKSLMQDAPDVEARAAYQPRYPSRINAADISAEERDSAVFADQDAAFRPPAAQSPDGPIDDKPAIAGLIPEPPIADDDTRPNPAITEEPAKPAANQAGPSVETVPSRPIDRSDPDESIEEPSFLSEVTVPTPAASPPPPPEKESLLVPLPPEPRKPLDMVESDPEQATVSGSAAPKEDKAATDEHERAQRAEPVSEEKDVQPERAATPEPPSDLMAKLAAAEASSAESIFDTSQISVFEVFGLQKPSETQEFKALQTAESKVILPISSGAETEVRRAGLRRYLRSKLVSLRRNF